MRSSKRFCVEMGRTFVLSFLLNLVTQQIRSSPLAGHGLALLMLLFPYFNGQRQTQQRLLFFIDRCGSDNVRVLHEANQNRD